VNKNLLILKKRRERKCDFKKERKRKEDKVRERERENGLTVYVN